MIRNFKDTDYDFYKSASIEFYNSEAVTHPIPHKNFDNTFNLMIEKSPFVDGYIIEHHNVNAGYAILSKTYSNEAGGIVLWIEELYILPDFQNKGLGKKLLNYIFEKYNYVPRLRLEVSQENTEVMDYYRKLGFDTLSYIQMVKE